MTDMTEQEALRKIGQWATENIPPPAVPSAFYRDRKTGEIATLERVDRAMHDSQFVLRYHLSNGLSYLSHAFYANWERVRDLPKGGA